MCFFFQAEDGIRDVAVTGVQTCALPISLRRISERTGGRLIRVNGRQNTAAAFGEIAKELRTEYFLGYSPTNLRHDGSFRKLVGEYPRKYSVRSSFAISPNEIGRAHV